MRQIPTSLKVLAVLQRARRGDGGGARLLAQRAEDPLARPRAAPVGPRPDPTFSGPRTTPEMKVAVTGASGLVGSALVPVLRDAGHDVLTLTRRAPEGDAQVAWDPEAGTIDTAAARRGRGNRPPRGREHRPALVERARRTRSSRVASRARASSPGPPQPSTRVPRSFRPRRSGTTASTTRRPPRRARRARASQPTSSKRGSARPTRPERRGFAGSLSARRRSSRAKAASSRRCSSRSSSVSAGKRGKRPSVVELARARRMRRAPTVTRSSPTSTGP